MMRNASKIGIGIGIVVVLLAVFIIYGLSGYRFIGQVSGLRRQCKKDDAFACYKVGRMYEYGQNVSVDLHEARSYYRKSCSIDPKWGCEEASRLEHPNGGSNLK